MYSDMLSSAMTTRECFNKLYRDNLSTQNSIKVYNSASDPDFTNDGFWRIALGEPGEMCFLMTTKFAELIDFRVLHLTFAI